MNTDYGLITNYDCHKERFVSFKSVEFGPIRVYLCPSVAKKI